MSTKTKTIQNGTSKTETTSVFSRAFTSDSEWPDKEEFLDVIYWIRQFLGIILGVVWGFLPMRGFLGLVLFGLINAGLLYVYITSFQNVDEEEFGGTWELTKEGFMTSFAGFLAYVKTESVRMRWILLITAVTWIIIFTGLYYEQEKPT